MLMIDANAHVIESDQTWAYMDASEDQYRPATVVSRDVQGKDTEYWIIEGKALKRRLFDPERARTSVEAGELLDVSARLKHMDDLGVDVQVLYPTIFLNLAFHRPAIELALSRSYNRWLADIWRAGGGRLRWVVVPPLQSMDVALEELRLGKEHGACGVFMRGVEGDRIPSNEAFFPLYEEAQRLDMPICFHAGSSGRAYEAMFPVGEGEAPLWFAKGPVLNTLHTLALNNIPDQFPALRWGFIEASSAWVPFALHDLSARFKRIHWQFGARSVDGLLERCRFFVACQTDDDLEYVLKYAGQNQLIIGSDYGHADTASELEALSLLKGQGKVASDVIDRILTDNPRRLYGIQLARIAE